jgi:hypothetical protein
MEVFFYIRGKTSIVTKPIKICNTEYGIKLVARLEERKIFGVSPQTSQSN